MQKIVFLLCCVLFLSGCGARLPSFLNIQINNGTKATPSVCADGIQLTLSKGLEVWTSLLVVSENTYSLRLEAAPAPF
jgi:hypothetical protein